MKRLNKDSTHNEKSLFIPVVFTGMAQGFRDRVVVGTDDECWVWAGGCESRGGRYYGRWQGELVHRLAYGHGRTHYPGQPEYIVVQVCGVSLCVNPCHLIGLNPDHEARFAYKHNEINWRKAMARLEEWQKEKAYAKSNR